MLNFLWGAMLLIGIVYGAATGRMNEVTDAALSSAKEAVSLCITMAGIVAMWVGIMEIAKSSGLVERLTRKMRPLLGFLFPDVPGEHRAATPFGLKAMEELAKLEKQRKSVSPGTASNAMCTFLILNISSLQLIPVNIIAYRSQYGSVNPTAIVGPGIVATAVSTVVAVIFCKVMERK